MDNKITSDESFIIDPVNMKQYWYTLKDSDGKDIEISDFLSIISQYTEKNKRIIEEKLFGFGSLLKRFDIDILPSSFALGYIFKLLLSELNIKLNLVSSTITDMELRKLSTKIIDENISNLEILKKKMGGDTNNDSK